MISKNISPTLWKKLSRLPNTLVIALILLYRAVFSPSVGVLRFLPFYPRPSCIFYPTCSEYGTEVFTKYQFGVALKKTVIRIGKCHPGNHPQVDLP